MQTDNILILGVTASGKGSVGFALAQRLGAEILSVDSMKIYKRMDIGTAKPSQERRAAVPCHAIDIVEPYDTYNVGLYYEYAYKAIHDIQARQKPVVAIGGTALYIKALLYGLFDGPGADQAVRSELLRRSESEGTAALHKQLALIDPDAAQRISPNDERRIVRALEVWQMTGKPISSFQTQFDVSKPRHGWCVIGLRREKAMESQRINARVKKMVDSGLVQEVRGLLSEDRPLSPQAAVAIGYAEIIDHLQGKYTLEEAVERIKINTRRLAKSQRTWFKTFRQVQWIDINESDTVETTLSRAIDIIEQYENQ